MPGAELLLLVTLSTSFGSEFSVLKTAVEITEGLRYKLRMMGVPLGGPAHILADNQPDIIGTARS